MELVPDPPNARVHRAFAFVDMCGFTQLVDTHGDAEALRALTGMRARVRAACAHYGVRVAKWLGDGAMLVGVDTAPLACAAFEIAVEVQTDGLPIRGGMSVGEVLMFEGDDYIGRTVNLAARLCDRARPSELLAPIAVGEHLPKTLEMRGLVPLTIAGFRGQVDVASVQLAAPTGLPILPSGHAPTSLDQQHA